jgi:Ca2+-binding EF-hand superfamily protein
MNLEDNEIVRCFKQIDQNFDGKVSKEELIFTFGQAGIDVEQEIDAIMNNIDIDQSGVIDYTELKIVLTDWNKEIKRKNIAKLFGAEGGFVNLKHLMSDLENVLPSEWRDFTMKVKPENNLVSLAAIKSYIKSSIE